MTGSITIKFDTISQERRDIYAASMIALLERIMKGVDEVNITYTNETPVMRGKHKTTKTTKWEVGQDAPTFEELGIYSTQKDMFEPARSDYRTYTAPIGSGLPDHGTAVAEGEEDQPAAEREATEQPEAEQCPAPPDDQAQPPTVDETAEALGPWAYLLEESTDKDERSHEQEQPEATDAAEQLDNDQQDDTAACE